MFVKLQLNLEIIPIRLHYTASHPPPSEAFESKFKIRISSLHTSLERNKNKIFKTESNVYQ